MRQLNLTKSDFIRIVNQYSVGKFESERRIKTSGSWSFLIFTESGKYFLRLCGEHNRWRSQKEIEGELNLIDWLEKNNFPVINYEKMNNGSRVVSLKNHNGYLRKFLQSKQVLGEPTEEQLFKVGKILGEYHKIVKNYKVGGLREGINFGPEVTRKYFQKNKEMILKSNSKNKEKIIEIFEKEINKINLPKNLAKGMIHEDLGRRHVLWQGKKIKAVIDFDRSYYGYLLLDLGQALRGWCFKNNWGEWSGENCIKFLSGYESERRLSGLEKRYLLPAIKFGILERALAFYTKYVYSRSPGKEDEEFALDSLFRQINKVEI